MRRADGVAAQPGPRGRDPPDVRLLVCHTPRATARWPLPFTFSAFDYRALCGCCGRSTAPGRSSRPPRSTGERIRRPQRLGGGTAHGRTDRLRRRSRRRYRAHRPRRRRAPLDHRRARLEARASPPSSCSRRTAALARAGGPSGRHGEGPRAVDRQARDAGGLRLGVPRRRRGADRHRLVRSARPRQGADEPARRARSASARRLPGQLDPAPHPRRRRGRRVLRRRLGRPLHPAHRRGHPDGLVLRRSPAGASCATCSRDAPPAGRRSGATALRARARWKFEACSGCSGRCRSCARGRWAA